MKDPSRARLSTVASRFGSKIAAADADVELSEPAFRDAFLRARDGVIAPCMREVGDELARTAGARYEIVTEEGQGSTPASITLRLFLTPRAPAGHRVVFTVARDERAGTRHVLALLEASPPPMDLARYAPGELNADVVEQLVVDAVEQIYACVAELPRRGAR